MSPKPPPGFEPVKTPAPVVAAPPPPAGFKPVDVPAFRNSATVEGGLQHRAVGRMPSQIMHEGIANVAGDTVANIAGYLPPVLIGGAWADAYANEKMNPDPRNAGTKMLEEYENLHRGVGQGTNPYVSEGDGREELGEAFQDAGGAWMFQTPDGRGELINPDHHVMLKDQRGKLKAYSRSKQTDEGGLTSASRMMMPGLLTGPVTGPSRAMALAGPEAGNIAAQRSIEAGSDVAAFDRLGIEPFSPAFAGTPTKIAAKSLSDMWGVGAPLNTAIENTYGGMARAATGIADNLSPVTTFDQAGASLQHGLKRFQGANSKVLEPGVVRDMGIDPNAAVPAKDIMGKEAAKRVPLAEAARLENQRFQANPVQTARGVNLPPAKTRNQTFTQRRAIEDMEDHEVQSILKAPAQTTSFATRAEALYEMADRQLPKLMRANDTANPNQLKAANTQKVVAALRGEQESSQIPGGVFGRYGGMADRLGTNVQLGNLRAMRTAVGRDLSNFNYGDVGLDRTQLKALYGALSRDIELSYMDLANRAHINSRLTTNGPQKVAPEVARAADRALYEFRRADRYFRQGMERIDRFSSIVGADRPEQAAQRLIQASQEGGRANIGLFRSAMSALRPEERADFAALVVREMGKPLPSARGVAQETGFSPQSFTTRYQKMDQRMRDLLFPGDHGRAIDDLFQVSNRMANVEAFANTSNSARSASNVGGIGTAGAMLATGQILPLIGGAGGMYATSYLLSRPQYARWAANYQRMKSVAQRQPQQVNAALITHVNRLAEMARFDPQLQPVLQAISGELGVVEGQDGNRQKDENHSRTQSQEGEPRKRHVIPHSGHSNTGQE